MKRIAKVGLRITISLGLIIYLVSTQDIHAIRDALLSFNMWYLPPAFVLLVLGTFFSSSRWRVILQTSHKDVDVLHLMVFYVKGYFYNNFLPTQMGGDVYKSLAVGNLLKDHPTALFSVFMDRFSGLLVLLTLALFGIGSLYGMTGVAVSLGVFCLGVLLYFPLLKILSRKIHFFQKFNDASTLFMQDKYRALLVLGYSVLVQACSFSMVYLLFLGFHRTLPVWSVIAYMPLTSLSLLIPSFNGFGTQEVVYSTLFASVGVTAALSISVSLLVHTIRLIMSLVGGVLILFGIGDKKI